MTMPNCPQVYRAINAITAAFAKDGIAKTHTNLVDQYQYRSIDDVLNRLGPLLARHRLCVLPRVLKRQSADRIGELDKLLIHVRLLVAFDLTSTRDGSHHTVQCWGEALDAGDKGTAKAMSSAYKSAMLQAFCIPVCSDDPDGSSHRLQAATRDPAPPEGWQAWSEGIRDMIGVCERCDALDRVRTRHRGRLEAIRRERPDLYATIGEAFSNRSQQLAAPRPSSRQAKAKAKPVETIDA